MMRAPVCPSFVAAKEGVLLRVPSRRSMVLLAVLLSLVALTGCNRFRVLDATIPTYNYDRARNIAYGDAPRQALDVYYPHRLARPARIVVFFYGGDWRGGHKEDYRFAAQALASRGFIAVVPDYRVYPEVMFPAFVDDGARAVRWVHDHAASLGGDPGRVYLMGHSAGAYIATMLAFDPRYLRAVGLDRSAIRAVAGLSGPYDFDPGGDAPIFGVPPGRTYPFMEPITFADGGAPPTLLLHGGRDTYVHPDNTVRLAEKLRASGATARSIVYPKLDHVGVALALAAPFRWLGPVLDDTATFFREH